MILRGSAHPDLHPENSPSPHSTRVSMADIFISYSSEDKTIVQRLAALLEARGWSVWWDRQIPIGRKYDEVIETELQQAGCVLVIWTQRSIASEWVKNEALDAAQRNKLVPVVLERLTLPLAFRRIEAAMLPGWNGSPDHPELPMLYDAIGNILHPGEKEIVPGTNGNLAGHEKKGKVSRKSLLVAALIGGILLLTTIAFWLLGKNSDKIVTVRVFDWKKHPLTQGNVKIYLDQYIRTESVDNMGQALFTGIPGAAAARKIKLEVSSPGYATKTYDTLLVNGKPLELILPLTADIVISGKVKTAAEMPIKEVEIDVDGTRYYAISITDGSYSLRLKEYTLGDVITLTTSHPDYEDKSLSLRISSPDITNEDIFLNPAKQQPAHKN